MNPESGEPLTEKTVPQEPEVDSDKADSAQKSVPGEEAFPTSSEEMEKEKQAIHEMWAQNNTGAVQFFVQNMNYGSAREYRETDAPKPEKSESFHLENASECARFVEKYRDSEYVALAITLSAFDQVLLSDLPELKAALLSRLPVTKTTDSQGKEIVREKADPYLSLDSVIAVIGGKRWLRDDGKLCVGFGKTSRKVLTNFWEQFPSLHADIISWLMYLHRTYSDRTAFDEYQVARLFSRVAALDFLYAKHEIFSELYEDPGNEIFLGILACELCQEPNLEAEMKTLALNWAQAELPWLWRSALLMYALLEDKSPFRHLEEPFKRKVARCISSPRRKDFSTLPLILYLSSAVRTMFCEAFWQGCRKASTRQEQLKIAEVYIEFLRYGYYMVDSSSPVLPLVACDSARQQHFLTPVLSRIMPVYWLRKRLYFILAHYLREISKYQVSNQLLNHLAAYFQNIMLSSPHFRQDVMDFLKNSGSGAAARIYDLLRENERSRRNDL